MPANTRTKTQNGKHGLLGENGAVIGRGVFFLLLGADAHHRRIDGGMLDGGGEQHHHPGEGEPPELLDAQVARKKDCRSGN